MHLPRYLEREERQDNMLSARDSKPSLCRPYVPDGTARKFQNGEPHVKTGRKGITNSCHKCTSRDQDTTWPAANESVRRGYDKQGHYLQGAFQVWSLGCVARFGV